MNYKEIHIAYNEPLSVKIELVEGVFGRIFLILLGVIGIFCFVFKKNRWNYILLALIIITEVTPFFMTQKMGIHHQLIIAAPAFLIFMMPFTFKVHIISKQSGCILNVFNILFFLLFLLNFYNIFTNKHLYGAVESLLSDKYKPHLRNDIKTIKQLVTYLNDISQKQNAFLYTTTSSPILSDEILNNSELPNKIKAVPRLYKTAHVDLRDGFPTRFFSAGYIIASNENQTHLNSGQHVVSYLNEKVKDPQSGIGRHFKLIKTFQLDKGVEALIYKKVSDYEDKDLIEARNYFTNIYPNHPQKMLYRINLNFAKE